MSTVSMIYCDFCQASEDKVLYLVGSDEADLHVCNYCLDKMNQRAIEYLEGCERDIDLTEGADNGKF